MQSVLKAVEEYIRVHPEIETVHISAKAYPVHFNDKAAEVTATVVSKYKLEAAPF